MGLGILKDLKRPIIPASTEKTAQTNLIIEENISRCPMDSRS